MRIKASSRFDEPVTQDALDKAIKRGRERGSDLAANLVAIRKKTTGSIFAQCDPCPELTQEDRDWLDAPLVSEVLPDWEPSKDNLSNDDDQIYELAVMAEAFDRANPDEAKELESTLMDGLDPNETFDTDKLMSSLHQIAKDTQKADALSILNRVKDTAPIMKCPVCGATELIHDTRDLPYTYKNQTTVIPAVTADFCPSCNESITDMSETDRVMRLMQEFHKKVNI